jgi:poly(A) polymerase
VSVSIGAPPWMTAAETQAVIAALEAKAYPGCARFVGGAVRNSLMGREVDDIDIATLLTPDQVIEALEAAGLRAVPTGIDHGTVMAVASHKAFEITTLRRDIDTDGRHAVVAFTQDWAEDARRRDFRLNALYADTTGTVFDPTGEGVADARAGRIVFVGDARIRVREDYLRILRFFRFHAWYGRGEPDQAALDACRTLRGMLAGGTAERLQKELLKMLAAADPRVALALMGETGVLAEVLPEVTTLQPVERLVAADMEHGLKPEADLRLAALWPADAAVIEPGAERLRLSNTTRNRLLRAIAAEPAVSPLLSPKGVRQAVWRVGAAAFCDAARLAWAKPEALAGADQWLPLIALARAWSRPAMPVNGDDAIAAGVPRGQAIGQALAAFEAWWIEQDFPASRPMALARLMEIASALKPRLR